MAATAGYVFTPERPYRMCISESPEVPFSPNNVFDNEIDFWSIEGCFAFFLGPVDTQLSRCGTTGFFGSIPSIRFTNVLVAVRVTQSDTYTVIVHAEACTFSVR